MSTLTLRPDGAGSETAVGAQEPSSGSHWQKVDEAVTDDTDYVYENHGSCDGTEYRDLYALPACGIVGTINSVTVYARLKVDPSGFGACKISLRTNATTYDYSKNINNSFAEYNSGALNTNPQTTAAWTVDEIDALEIGVNLKDCTGLTQYCSQVWVVVDYTGSLVTNYVMGCSVGTFTLTGVAVTLARPIINMVASVGNFVLTGIATTLTATIAKWHGLTKHTTLWTNKAKNTTSWVNKSKNTTSWNNKSKNTTSWANKSKNTTNWTFKTKN